MLKRIWKPPEGGYVIFVAATPGVNAWARENIVAAIPGVNAWARGKTIRRKSFIASQA